MDSMTEKPSNFKPSEDTSSAADCSAICCICNNPLTDTICFGNEIERWHTYCADGHKRLPRRYEDSPNSDVNDLYEAKKETS
jgi:hypothetical protein